MELLIFYVGLCVIPGYIAGQRGRSALGFFFLGILISPLLALIIVALVPSRVAAGPVAAVAKPARQIMICPNCDKAVSPYWKTNCKHCGAAFPAAA